MRESFPPKAADFLRDIHIIQVGEAGWNTRIIPTLSEGEMRPPSRAILNVLQIAEKELRCKSMLVEPYVSTDFADEYSIFYSKLFQPMPRICRRIHFFAGIGPNARTLERIDIVNMTNDVRGAYLGYCVVRPTTPLSVGDTVLASPVHRGNLDLVHCQATFEAHILGHTLSVRGMPFIQQDSAVGVCADSDLWMLARYMHRIGECRRYRPGDMRELATKGLFIGEVRDGLIKEQMMDALRQMGLSPEYFWAGDAEQTIALLYSCIESEIPVIVGIPGHVVTVIGHGYHNVMNFSDDQTTMASCVDGFVAHDDATRPYRWMPISTVPDGDDSQRLLLDGKLVDWCIFPEPQRVHLRRSDILSHLHDWLTEIPKISFADSAGQPVKWLHEDELCGLVTREYLRRSDKFKEDIYPPEGDERWNNPNFVPRPMELSLRYWCQHMPKYVWVVELSRKSDLSGNTPLNRRIVGEVIFDSTGYHYDPIGCLLAFHLNEKLIIRKIPPDNEQFEFVNLSLHNGYSPLLRLRA